MAIFRVHKDTNYTVMSNHHIKNPELSNAAKGLMCIILSLPDDWEFSVGGLVSLCRDGVAAVRSQLDELEEQGYVVRESVRDHGRFATIWDIHEVPVDDEDWRDLPATEYESEEDIPELEDPQTTIPGLDVPVVETKGRRKGKRKADVAKVTNEVIAYLNERTGRKFKPRLQKTKNLVSARLNEGFDVEDFKRVIDNKADDWGRDPKMRRFLRPETLFGTKFEGYLQEGAGSVRHDFSEYN